MLSFANQTLSLHDALPIFTTRTPPTGRNPAAHSAVTAGGPNERATTASNDERRSGLRPATSARSVTTWSLEADRKSTRLNSSHLVSSYAVFCLKYTNIYTT